MAINVFDSFLREFEQPITAFVSTSVSNLASYIDGPLRVAVTLYVVLYGFAVMRGAISEPIMEFAWRAMRIVVVVLLATNSSTFQQYVTSLFFDSLPKEIGKESKNRLVTYCWNVLEFVASRTTTTIRIARQANSMIGSEIAPRITAKP